MVYFERASNFSFILSLRFTFPLLVGKTKASVGKGLHFTLCKSTVGSGGLCIYVVLTVLLLDSGSILRLPAGSRIFRSGWNLRDFFG